MGSYLDVQKDIATPMVTEEWKRGNIVMFKMISDAIFVQLRPQQRPLQPPDPAPVGRTGDSGQRIVAVLVRDTGGVFVGRPVEEGTDVAAGRIFKDVVTRS